MQGSSARQMWNVVHNGWRTALADDAVQKVAVQSDSLDALRGIIDNLVVGIRDLMAAGQRVIEDAGAGGVSPPVSLPASNGTSRGITLGTIIDAIQKVGMPNESETARHLLTALDILDPDARIARVLVTTDTERMRLILDRSRLDISDGDSVRLVLDTGIGLLGDQLSEDDARFLSPWQQRLLMGKFSDEERRDWNERAPGMRAVEQIALRRNVIDHLVRERIAAILIHTDRRETRLPGEGP